jgi:hypothetical protein
MSVPEYVDEVESEDDQLRDEEVPLWDIRETCYMSLNRQGSAVWKNLRIGCIQASLIGEICERTHHNDKFPQKTPRVIAETLCGLTKFSYSATQALLMSNGIRGEPIIRNWFAKEIIRTPITEVGVAVWKSDPYFRVSLDGETKAEDNSDAAVEIKIPEYLNKKYIEVFHSWGRGVNNPHPDEYIFRNHYDQMTMGSVVTNKSGCWYVVACMRDSNAFYQYINTDTELWNKVLYPRAKRFHSQHVLPLLKEHNIKVIMP